MATRKKKGARRPSPLARFLPDRRTGLYILAAIVLILAVFFGFTNRMLSQQAAVKKQIAAAQQDLTASKAELARLANGQSTQQTDVAKAQQYDQMLPYTINAAQLAADISTEADRYGVKVTQMDPGDDKDASVKGLRYKPFTMSATGQPSALAAWMSALQQRTALLTLDRVSYGASGSSSGAAPAVYKLSFTLRAWYDTGVVKAGAPAPVVSHSTTP